MSSIRMGAKDVVHSTIRMMIPPEKHGEAVRILRSIVEQDRIQAGCLSSRIYKDAEENNTLMFEEIWRSEEELKHHLQSEEYPKVLLVAEMALERPEIRFEVISSTTGIETIEKARGLRQMMG